MSHHHHGHADANEKHFDEHGAEVLGSEHGKKLGRQAAEAFLNAFTFDKEKTTVLDFACGNGNVSFNMAGSCKSIVGVDISTKMIELYNEMAQKEGLSDKISGLRVDITSDACPLGDQLFDVIVCSLSYHHLTSPDEMTRILSKFLVPGGLIMVIDFMPGTGIEDIRNKAAVDDYKHIIAHMKGFPEEQMRTIYEAGEIELKSYKFAFEMLFKGVESNCFIAVGQKK